MEEQTWVRLKEDIRRELCERGVSGSVTLHFHNGEYTRAEYRFFVPKGDEYEVTATAA